MPPDEDPEFQARADAHIDLSNSQMEKASRGKVSASMMYSVARFNAWVSACGYDSGEEMREKKSETIAYFLEQYSKMLEENLDNYADNFERYMKRAN
jgi:hypothetical protein